MADNRHLGRNLQGIERAMRHAVTMHQEGRLHPKDLDEFRRSALGTTIDLMPVDAWARLRSTQEGNDHLQRMMEEAGQDYREDPREEREMIGTRDRIVRRILSDYIGQLWENGQMDDETYIQQMEGLRMVKLGEGTDSQNPKDLAAKIYAAANGMDDPDGPNDAAPDDSLQVDQEHLDAFRKRNPRKGWE